MNFNIRLAALSLVGIGLFPYTALAIGGTDQIAAAGKAAAVVEGWPEGVQEVINDAVRTNGWHSWFSECPNDTRTFELHIRNGEDAARLVRKLAAVKSDRRVIRLAPGARAEHAGGAGAVFTLGNQPELTRWYLNLPEVSPGFRQFGVHLYSEMPTAQPPTLTLYVGHEAIDLKALGIPPAIEVEAAVTDAYRGEHKDDAILRTIDAFIDAHNVARTGMTKPAIK